MSEQELEKILDRLHDELTAADTLDADQISKLRAAVNEIQLVLDRADGSGASLATRLRDAVQDFEGSHPTLTKTVSQVADILSQMGI